MEDVLDLYEEEYDPQYPTVCLDEKPVELHADVQPPVPVEPGKPERVDYEYERRGTRNVFVMVEPTFGLAARGSDQATHHAGLRQSGAASSSMRSIRTRSTFAEVAGQLEHAHAGGPLRNLSAR
jgi:hypothetical protein